MKKWLPISLSLMIVLTAESGCNNYDLDNRIRVALSGGSSSGGSLSLSAPVAQAILIQNKSTQLAQLQFTTTGGTQPYAYTFTTIGAVPPNMVFSVSTTGLVTITRNTGVPYPPSVNSSASTGGLTQAGSIVVKVNDANGTSQDITYPLTVRFKRAFITSAQDTSNFPAFAGGFAACLGQPSPITKANCVCQNAATNANLPAPAKYRAWISATGVDAKCNITNNPTQSGCAVNTNDGGPWFLTTGNRLATDMGTSASGSLLSGTTPLEANFDRDEFGAVSGAPEAFTATLAPGGTFDGANNCGNWVNGGGSLQFGLKTTLTSTWTANGVIGGCAGGIQGRLYCFEAD